MEDKRDWMKIGGLPASVDFEEFEIDKSLANFFG